MGVSAVRIQDKDGKKRLSVVRSTSDPTKYGLVLVNPDGSKIGGGIKGPSCTCDGDIVLFEGTDGKKVCDSGVKLCDKQDVCNMVDTLAGADHCHYPTAKAVTDAMSCLGGGDMLKSVYDPNNCNGDAFDFNNFYNKPQSCDYDINNLGDSCGCRSCWDSKQDALIAGDNIDITSNVISAADMRGEISDFSSTYGMTQWSTAKKGDVAKVQAIETKTINGYGSITIENGVEGGISSFNAYGYSENVSPLPSGYIQYDAVSGSATVTTGLTGANATFTVSGSQGAVRLRDNGTLVFLGVPCKNTSNVVGFYDLISNSFKTPDSTLTAGNVVEGPTPEVPRDIMTNNGILKYNNGSWYTDGDAEKIKISYLG